jgi:hypothetical protein
MRRKAGLFVVLAAALALGAFLFLRYRGVAEPEPEPFPPDALDGYVPADSAALITLNVRSLSEAPFFQGRLRPTLNRLVRRGAASQRWMDLAGIDPAANLDRLQISFAAGDPEHPLWLARGRFSPARFQVGPGKLQPRVERGRRVYEYTDPDFGPMLLAPVGDTLVVSAARGRVDDALAYAAGHRAAPLRYPALAALLKQVDQKQAVWLAASLEDFGPVGRMEGMELVLRPVLTHARTVAGSLHAADDLRADFTFQARDADAARLLEDSLKSAILLAQGARLLGIDRDLLPLLQLMGSGETTRDGTAVTLRCRLPAAEVQP